MGASEKIISQLIGAANGVEHDPLWYKDAVIYQVHVKSFFDANNDGVGDFAGLIAKLDYIAGLGVTAIWLLPFYPSPRRDDGYDIAQYKDVHPDYGGLADARRFVQEAHRRGLRVITELVINHTSDQHPWFQRARRAKPGSAARNFYVWSDNDQAYAGTRIIFLDTETSNWTWDPLANAFFWHRFYSHQPDLNFDNPAVLKEVLRVMKFWLELGIDGLRLDAVPYLIEREGTSNENLPETHTILKKIRAELDRTFPGRMLLAEANMWPEDVQQYFGQGDECHMAFHFPLMPRMYMALAQEDRFPLTDILRQTPEIPPACQWSIFLRNHDELTLEMVTNKERDYLWNFYAEDRRARINLGIRRRLAPLLQRDRRRIELLNSFLLSMPGTPVIYYGDEIGMGDNIHLGDRDGVRTPMQWTSDRNAGFSRADPARLVLPPIMDPVYGFQAINVEAQDIDAHSLLNWMRRLLQVRGKHPAFGRGTLRLLYPNNRKVFAYLREYEHPEQGRQTILCVANVSSTSQAVELDLSEFAGRVPVEMLGGVAFPPIGQLTYLLTLAPYGFNWFALASDSRMPTWHTAAPEPLPEYATLVLRQDISELLSGRYREVLEREALPQYLMKRRWYAGKQDGEPEVRILTASRFPAARAERDQVLVLAEVLASTRTGHESRYLLPVGLVGEDEPLASLPQQLALARVRRGKEVGFLTDAFALDRFAIQVVDLMRSGSRLPSLDGIVSFDATPALAALNLPTVPEIRRITAEQSNSSLVIGDQVVLKIIRKLDDGMHPEAEMGRFLTVHGFAHTPATLGEVFRTSRQGSRTTLILLQRFLHNQGDGWQWTLNTLERAAHPGGLPALDEAGAQVDKSFSPLHELAGFASSLGKRLAQMHAVLASAPDDPAFSPEAADEAKTAQWIRQAIGQFDAALAALEGAELTADAAGKVEGLRAARHEIEVALETRQPKMHGALGIRIHGDFHLGQVLVSQGDVWLVDFEGEPSKTLVQRRAKASPWRDVAGLLRSFEYAAAFAKSGSETSGASAELLEHYLVSSRRAFVQAYKEHAAAVALKGSDALLQMFILEKAAYEVCYEAANRPTWIEVPLAGLSAAADELLSKGSHETRS